MIKWNLVEHDMKYEQVMRAQAQFEGMLDPVFEESLSTNDARVCGIFELDTSRLPSSLF